MHYIAPQQKGHSNMENVLPFRDGTIQGGMGGPPPFESLGQQWHMVVIIPQNTTTFISIYILPTKTDVHEKGIRYLMTCTRGAC